ncbi:MAG: peptide transporter permease [Firmicutes bacterium]|nr:peptide transporter permease [Bacillota bacterium]
MGRYLIKRLLWLVPVLLGITFVIHTVMSLVPGDPALILLGDTATREQRQALRTELGLDRPFMQRYVTYVERVVTGDLGKSYRSRRPVTTEIADSILPTIKLGAISLLFTMLMGIPAGVLSAVKRNSWFDHTATLLSLLGLSMPVFWTGLLLIYYLAYKLPIFPVGGMDNGLMSYILPGFTLALNSVAMVSRMTRSSMLDVLQEDFVRTARAKGVPDRTVIFRHALKAAFVPILTVLGLQVGLMLGGAVLTETVFSWPGIGRAMVGAIMSRDLLMVQGSVLVLATCFVVVNLATDLCYGFFDPRIRYE